MQPLLFLSCADQARHAAIAKALVGGGLELTDSIEELATIHILESGEGLSIRNGDEILIQLSVLASPDDILGLVRLGLELTTLWGIVRSFEDSESASVIATNTAHEARNALVPVMFAADALALDYPGARELTRLLVDGCDHVARVLHRITPVDRAGTTAATCANTMIGELLATMRAIAHRAKLFTRLETPLAPIAIEQPYLERMVLILVAHAADAARNSARIVVATSARVVRASDARETPAGDWVVIEVEDDGESMDELIREAALKPTFVPTPSAQGAGFGLPGVAQLTRSAGGHLSIDNNRRGAKIGIWLPRADVSHSE